MSSRKILVPVGCVAYGVARGWVKFPEKVLTDTEINKLEMRYNRVRFEERHRKHNGPANPEKTLSQCQ